MKTNFHTHHELCRHAGGRCEDYVKEAIRNGYNELGFSDHAPNDIFDLGLRMKQAEFDIYLKDIEYVQSKYSNQLTIYKGIEIEYFYTTPEYYTDLNKQLDYMILGQHLISMNNDDKDLLISFDLTTPSQIIQYGRTLCDAMETGLFDIIAHPELYMNGYLDFDEHATKVAHQICRCAERTNTIFEFNANGFRRAKVKTPQGTIAPYPRKEFWNIVKQYDVRTIFASDCHSPDQLYDDVIREAEEIYQSLDVKKITRYDEIKQK